jgi:metal-responsive CopG/Arc/MetJ family transcriptional regulator
MARRKSDPIPIRFEPDILKALDLRININETRSDVIRKAVRKFLFD